MPTITNPTPVDRDTNDINVSIIQVGQAIARYLKYRANLAEKPPLHIRGLSPERLHRTTEWTERQLRRTFRQDVCRKITDVGLRNLVLGILADHDVIDR